MLRLVLVNLLRNKLRTVLTMASVTVALFLYCSLGGVLDTLQESIKVGSETRLVTRNKVSLIFPLPIAYRARLQAMPGVRRVAVSNWFGGTDPVNPHLFFAQFAVDDNYLPIYADDYEIVQASPAQAAVALPAGMDPRLAAYQGEQTACVVGETLLRKHGWHLGQTVHVNGTIYQGSWPFTIRAVYRSRKKAFRDETMFFHWKYLEQQGMGGQGSAGLYVLQLADPSQAANVATAIDAGFENAAPATRTESEQAFQAGFVSMYGNLPFVLRVIGLAIVFSILLIAANTMMTAVRERTGEMGVLKTLGFSDGAVFGMVVAEAACITLGGGVAGALLAKLAIERSGFNALGFLPPMIVYWRTVAVGVLIAVGIGAVSGLVPAVRAARLRIVDALRPAE
ncbi:MAG TPA: ABC transporter permease [Candidatus Eisenbacteria bacterium]|nr:ABC transporter permease [Candidatus Eisenbacteria bacterium]